MQTLCRRALTQLSGGVDAAAAPCLVSAEKQRAGNASTDCGREREAGEHRTGEERPTLEALAQRLAPSASHGRRPTIPDHDVGTLLAMPLDRFAREGQLLEVRVPWLEVTLWFVPEERDAEALGRDGVSRGRVWTAAELMDVMAISERTSDALRTIALAKLTFDGDIAAVIRRSGD